MRMKCEQMTSMSSGPWSSPRPSLGVILKKLTRLFFSAFTLVKSRAQSNSRACYDCFGLTKCVSRWIITSYF